MENREAPKKEPKVGKYSGFLYLDKNGMPMVALHWQKYFEHRILHVKILPPLKTLTSPHKQTSQKRLFCYIYM